MSDAALRLIIFIGALVLFALLEHIAPKRKLIGDKTRRWATNLSLVVINSLALQIIRLLFSVLAIGFAGLMTQKGWGLFNLLNWPGTLEIILAIVLLDGAIYFQHVISHKIDMFWQLHKVHHADRDIDVTTGIRFHPIEIMLSMVYKFAIILILGPAVFAVFLFEVLLNASAMFTHANLNMPNWLDKIIRLVFVTPDMHRVHHSVEARETDSNYGFNLSIWDKMFGTYIPQPKGGHVAMTIGLKAYQSDEPSKLGFCLVMPFGAKRSGELERPKKKTTS